MEVKMKRNKWMVALLLIVFLVTSCGSNSDSIDDNTSIETQQETKESVESSAEVVEDEVVVTFDCPELERLVRAELNKETGDILSTDMMNLYYIRPNGDNVKSLKGLEYAKNLMEFGILRNEIELESLDPISNLTSLTRINVSYTTVKEPVTFGKLDQVTYFALIDTNISDISYLSEFKSLEHLTLTNNGIENIDALSSLENLTQLNLSRNNISSLEALRGKDKIESLNIQSNNVSDIEPLEDLVSLQTATLSYNPITNLKPLEALPNLVELRIYQEHDVKHKIFDQVDLLENKGITVEYHK